MGNKKVGIMGGTFDPIHIGHLILAEAAYEMFELDYVLVMPNGNPPHKPGQVQADMDDRIHMTELAIAGNPHLILSDFENAAKGFHYTYQTLEYLRKEHPDTDYYFILGADSLLSFETWREPQHICRNCILLVATRDGLSYSQLDEQIERLEKLYHARIYKLGTPNIDISSHMIRKKRKEGKSIRYYVPESVEAYILAKGFYRTNQESIE